MSFSLVVSLCGFYLIFVTIALCSHIWMSACEINAEASKSQRTTLLNVFGSYLYICVAFYIINISNIIIFKYHFFVLVYSLFIKIVGMEIWFVVMMSVGAGIYNYSETDCLSEGASATYISCLCLLSALYKSFYYKKHWCEHILHHKFMISLFLS